jgi:hypothetical protein
MRRMLKSILPGHFDRCLLCGHSTCPPRGRGEMVDARDLKSLGGKPLCRFESGRPHQRLAVKIGIFDRGSSLGSETSRSAGRSTGSCIFHKTLVIIPVPQPATNRSCNSLSRSPDNLTANNGRSRAMLRAMFKSGQNALRRFNQAKPSARFITPRTENDICRSVPDS